MITKNTTTLQNSAHLGIVKRQTSVSVLTVVRSGQWALSLRDALSPLKARIGGRMAVHRASVSRLGGGVGEGPAEPCARQRARHETTK